MRKRLSVVFAIVVLSALLAGCFIEKRFDPLVPDPPRKGDDIEPSDYGDADNWMSAPQNPDKPADVFYLYPTAWTRLERQPYVCEIDREGMREGAREKLEEQAGAFGGLCNIYAPYYRQLDAPYLLDQPIEEQDLYLQGVPGTDAMAAFDYYIQNFNDGRPFILAGHSQGSAVLLQLLSEYMQEHPDVYGRMVAAYVIGFSVTGDFLAENPHLRFAESAEDTGVIVSYNTEAPEMEGENKVVRPGAVAINPISWTREGARAPESSSLGAQIKRRDGYERVENLADATVDLERGTVVCSTLLKDDYLSAIGSYRFPIGIYHSFDYPFYYYDIQANADRRVEAFLQSAES